MEDKHAIRIEIFNSTLALLRQGWYTAPSGLKVSLPSVADVMASSELYREPFRVMLDPVKPVSTESGSSTRGTIPRC